MFTVLYADRDGHIGYQAPGRIPMRRTGSGDRPVPQRAQPAEPAFHVAHLRQHPAPRFALQHLEQHGAAIGVALVQDHDGYRLGEAAPQMRLHPDLGRQSIFHGAEHTLTGCAPPA